MTFIYAPSKKNSDTLTLNRTLNRYDGKEEKKRRKYAMNNRKRIANNNITCKRLIMVNTK